MSKRNAVLILALSGALLFFSLGVLVSRPVAAQGLVSAAPVNLLPRQLDLWAFQIAPELYAPISTPGGTVNAYTFHVDFDAQDRLPVLCHSGYAGRAELWRKGPDGLYTMISDYVVRYPPYEPGLLLAPGDYAVQCDLPPLPENTEAILIGYWARP